MATTKFVRSSELHEHPQAVLREVTSTGESCYITQRGRAKAVLMDINRYNQIMDLIEEGEATKPTPATLPSREEASVKSILRRTTRTARR